MPGRDQAATHETAADDDMASMDHASMPTAHSTSTPAHHPSPMDHASMAGMNHAASHGVATIPAHDMSAMDHSKMHESHPAAPSSPAATLHPDEFDAAAPLSVAEAAKTATGHTAATTTGAAQEPAAVAYTCPMHPAVRSAVPGKCPICGMTLVKKEP
jgi:hypothetical protein